MNRKFKIPKTIKATLLALMLCIGARNAATAQTQNLVLPGYIPNYWYTPTHSPVLSLNTAMIYGYYAQLSVAVDYTGSGNYDVIALDPVLGYTRAQGLSQTPTGPLDIIIGNTGSATGNTDYIVAVAYPYYTGSGYGVWVDYFDLYDDGTTILLGYPVRSSYNTSATGTVTTVHIDVNPDYSNITSTGLPYCRYGFVTWDDVGGTGNVYAARLDLQISSGSLVSVTQTMGTGQSPDVSAIWRGVASPGHEVALVTYTDAAGLTLYEQDWDYTAPFLNSAITLDAVSASSSISVPRIDANHNYATNTVATTSNYKVVAQVYNGGTGHNEVRSYDNLLYALSTYFVSSNAVCSTQTHPPLMNTAYDNFAPVVALGGPPLSMTYPYNGTQYSIVHFTEDGTPDDVVFMEPVNDTFPGQVEMPADNYYWVSEGNGYGTIQSTSPNHAVSVSAPCNNPPVVCLYAWAYPTGGSDVIEYKINAVPTYYFRQSAPVTAPILSEGEVAVYPNPAQNRLIINTGGTMADGWYDITDILGRTLLHGGISGNNAEIDVSGLMPGTYIIRVNDPEKNLGQKLFVKN